METEEKMKLFRMNRRLEGLKDSLLTLIGYTSILPYIHTSKNGQPSIPLSLYTSQNGYTSGHLSFHSSRKRWAFTMAEILISLTIIGVIAAITLPSLRANINEKTWATQRKALYSRMSQAIAMMPSLNGYGIGTNNTETASKAAQAFITDGLSKVLKINNICDNANLKKCGLPDKISKMDNSKKDFPKKLSDLSGAVTYINNTDYYHLPDTLASGIETANGESIAVFYNPNCLSKDILYEGQDNSNNIGYYVQQHVCANFIYDLNGRKGPDKVGKDIGYITALYPVDSEVVMVLPVMYLDGYHKQIVANKKCKEINSEYRIPNREEALSIYFNNKLNSLSSYFWTSTSIDNTHAWLMTGSSGMILSLSKYDIINVLCVKH